MILYHGSNQSFEKVDLSKSKDKRDFGKGFYTTTIKEQALQWGYNMYHRFGGEGIILYNFEFSPTPDLLSKIFSKITEEWFDFILYNRTKEGLQHNYDYIQGPVANDKIYMTISGFIDGLYTKEEAMQRLAYSKANDQVSFHTQKAISLLKLQNKKIIPPDKFMYNGQELAFLVTQKIDNIVNLICNKENISFDIAYSKFNNSKVYLNLQNPASLLWAENAEFIVDEYYREINGD